MSSPVIASSPIAVPHEMNNMSDPTTTMVPTTTMTPTTTMVPVKPKTSSYVMLGLCVLICLGLWVAYHFVLYKFFRANPKYAAVAASF